MVYCQGLIILSNRPANPIIKSHVFRNVFSNYFMTSDGFTNILKLRIYKIECCYLHSQYIRINNTQFHEKNRKVVVSKFVKQSDELINKETF